MTDRYAVNLYEQLFIPKPWVSLERSRAPASARRRSPAPESSDEPAEPSSLAPSNA